MFGMVDENGVIRFSNEDINKCRSFLRGMGLEISIEGWVSSDMRGTISYHNAKWCVAIWKTQESVLPSNENYGRLSLVS